MEYSPKKMQEQLQKYGFNFKKNYGQNFIIDENTIQSIIKKSGVDENTMVLEIGPGAGSLTYLLSQFSKNVLCYEIDHKLEAILKENLEGRKNVKVIYRDFLKANLLEDLKEFEYEKLYVVANLPYYITTPIIIKLVEDQIPVDKIVVMVQKEVGDRFKALPGSKDYSSLSVYLNYYFDVKKLLDVSRNVFLPKPNVDSIVVEFKRKEKRHELKDETLFFQLIRDSFKQKRKTLKNNLKGYEEEKLLSVLKHYGYDLNVRAEQLPIEVFVDLANHL